MATKRLGRGLDALFGGEEASNFLNEQNGQEPSKLPLSKIEPDGSQPRKNFDKEALEELAESIRLHGVINPIAVRRVDGGYRIIAGERRWRAARMAGLREIPAVILEADGEKAMEMALIENLQREDLNPVEEARGYKSLLETYGMTQEKVAERVGKSRPAVANSLRLLALPAVILSLLEDGQLSGGHARALLPVEGEELKIELAGKIVTEGLSVRQAEKLAKLAARPQPEKGENKRKINYFEVIESDLARTCGRKVRITEGKDKGKIELEYYGSDDFERLVEALSSINM